MEKIYLYRLKATRLEQSPLFAEKVSKKEFIFKLLSSKPSEELRSGYIWHIGNVAEVSNEGLMFAVGRTTISSQEKYDEGTGDFIEVDDEESPFTFAFYDQKLGVLGLSPKYKLAPTTKGIARNLDKLLNASPYAKDNGVRIEVGEISDPESFIQQLHKAYGVVGFRMEFGEPNPFDVEKDFHAPMEALLNETRGEKGATTLQGEDLEREPLELLTRSVASVGSNASARIRQQAGDRPVTKHLKGDPASILVEDVGIIEKSAEVLVRLRNAYRKIRRALNDD